VTAAGASAVTALAVGPERSLDGRRLAHQEAGSLLDAVAAAHRLAARQWAHSSRRPIACCRVARRRRRHCWQRVSQERRNWGWE
jgi:hypothetical protein